MTVRTTLLSALVTYQVEEFDYCLTKVPFYLSVR